MPVEFAAAMNGSLGNTLERLEGQRRKRRMMLVAWAGILTAISLVLFYYSLWDIRPWIPEMSFDDWGCFRLPAFIVAASLAIFAGGSWYSIRFSLAGQFKAEAVPVILSTLVDEPYYNPSGVLAEHEFRSMGLHAGWDRYSGSEFISGERNGIPFAMSEFQLERADDPGNSDTEYTAIAHGTAFIASTGVGTHGWVVMFPRCFRTNMGMAFGEERGSDYLRLESREFMEHFYVRASDQVEGRMILTPAVMERLLMLRRRLGEISVSITAGRLNVIVWKCHGLSDSDGRKPFDEQQARRIRNWLYWMIGAIDVLKRAQERTTGNG